MMLIAADVGGTNARLGLFERGTDRPRVIVAREYNTLQHKTFGEILDAFAAAAGAPAIEAAAVAVAGPIVRQTAQLTNVPWQVSAAEIGRQLGISSVRLLNDLEAMASSIPVLRGEELESLQAGEPNPEGNAVVMAAGTGLGEAYLPRLDGRLRVLASEAGHTDFAARTDREIELVRFLRDSCGRVSVEHVLSGPGFRHLYRFTHRDTACTESIDLSAGDASAKVSQAGLDGRCGACREVVEMFAEALGAEAGNLGLRGTATAGVFIGGGIAPRILPALRTAAFLAAFRDKAPMDGLMLRMPVNVILNSDAGLLGAAVVASTLRG